MSDKITQTLGIDAGQALDALKQLDSAFKGFEDRLKTTAQAIRGFNDTAKEVNKLSAAFQSNLPASTQQVERLTTSLGLLSRVVFTQFIVRGLSQLRNAFQDTAESAIQFQKRLALISTIDDSGRSVAQLGNSVRNLSDQFNVPLLETAEGLYQSISNQVGDFGESLRFTAEAAQFARATNSSLANSVDLLSGVLKSYGLSVNDTDKVASTFFKTIDLGRVNANELANSFGRVGPIAAELGVSLDETGAALAAISVKGSKTSETLTQFRAILSALQKPTDELQKALRALGFTSSETAIRTLGLPGVLDALADSTGGSAEAMAKLFPNIRGLGGATSLLSDDLKTLSANISEMTAAGRDFSKEKFLQATATDAEIVTREINKLKNAFTVDLGQAVLKSVADFSQWTGGADSVVAAIKVAGPALVGLGGSFLLFRGQVLAANAGLSTFSKSLGALSLVPLAAGLGQSIGQSIDDKLVEARFRDLKNLEAENATSLELFKKQQTEARDFANAADEAKVKSARLAIQQLNKEYLADTDNARQASDALVTNSTAAIGKIVGARERLVSELAKSASDSEAIAKQALLRIQGLRDKQADIDFNTKLSGFDDAQKSFLLAQRAEELARDAGQKLATAVDGDAVARALALFNKAESTGEAAADIAKRTGDRAAEVRVAGQLKGILDSQVQAEQKLLALQDQRQASLERERDRQQKIVDAIRAQTKLALDNTGLFDKQGNQFNAADQQKREAARQAALK
jgi:TP901 family phage tail tape measure protein